MRTQHAGGGHTDRRWIACPQCRADEVASTADLSGASEEDLMGEGMTGDELRAARAHLGLSPGELAPLLGVDEQAVLEWESGRSAMPVEESDQVQFLEFHAAAEVTRAVEELATDLDAEPAVSVYRTEVAYRQAHPDAVWPLSWYQTLVGRVAQEVPGLSITYLDPDG